MTVWPDPELAYAQQPDPVLATLTLYGEARGESTEGKRGVLWVIRNRQDRARSYVAKTGKSHLLYGDGTVAGVVLKPWQFSCWNKGDPNLNKLAAIVNTGGKCLPSPVWETLQEQVNQVWADDPVNDPTWGATHYCTLSLWGKDDTAAWYGKPQIDAGRTIEKAVIGNHVFARA